MNVLQHTRNELNLCLKHNQPDRSYRDTLLNKVTGIHFSTVCLLISPGDWKYGMRFGEGVLTYTNGAGYRGQWVLDKVSALKERSVRASSPGRPRELARRLKRAYTELFCDKLCERRLSYRYPWYLIDASDVRLGYHWLSVRLVGLS